MEAFLGFSERVKGFIHRHHTAIMVVCCALPLVGAGAIALLGGAGLWVGRWASLFVGLLCPIGMGIMMFAGGHGRRAKDRPETVKLIEDRREKDHD